MDDWIVGLIGVMLIVYLFIIIIRPERKWDRLLQEDGSVAIHRFSAGGNPTGDKALLSDSEVEGTDRPGLDQRPPETAVAFPSAHGDP